MKTETTNSIKDIDEKEWEILVGIHSAEQSHQWFRTIEDSGMVDMHYVFLKENGTLAAAACCFVFTKKILNFELPFLEVGSPLGTSHAFFYKTPNHTDMLLKGLEQIRKKEKAKGLVISNLDEGFNTRQLKGFSTLPLLDDTYIDLNFKNFDEYLSFLPYKARGSVKDTLKRTEKLGVRTVFTNEFTKWMDVARTLQGYLCEKFNDYGWYLTEKFYQSLETHFKDTTELLLFFKDDIPLASIVALNLPDVAHYRFAGADPHYKKYQGYFLIYYQGIKRAIEKKQKRIYFGLTTYEFKEKIGCKRKPLFELVRVENPLFNVALKPYAAFRKARGYPAE